MSLIAELKRRKVFKVGAAYLVVGWLLIQISSTVAPQLNLPEWAPRLITFIVLLGFPIAILLAWAVDISAEGIKIESAPLGNKRVIATVAVLMALALGWYIGGRPSTTKLAAAPNAPVVQAAPAVPGVDPRSIAVLPFANMSGDPNAEYFSDGISEEILNVLARTPELSVAARTSSFAYRGKTDDIPQIARELKVRMILEGSVRKQGERVRITAQLIDADTGYHAWSETYDRDLKDIFAIQDEIAKAIGNELKVRIGGAAGASTSGTRDLEAHDLYLRGLALWNLRRGEKIWEGIALLERAIAKDPGYAAAHGGIALAYAVLPDYSVKIGYRESFARSIDAAEMALALDPTLAEPYAALANAAFAERRRTTTHALYRRAIELRPSFATAHQWLGTSLMAAGDPVAGLAEAERATALDPRSLVVANNHSVVLMTLGRYDDARAACQRVLEFAPDYPDCHSQVGVVALMQGQFEAARPHFKRYAEIVNPSGLPMVAKVIDALAGRGDRRAVARELAAFPVRAYLEPGSATIFSTLETPTLLVQLGEPGLALDYLERVSGEFGGSPEWPLMMPSMDPLRCQPRFAALLVHYRSKDPRAAQVCGGKAKP